MASHMDTSQLYLPSPHDLSAIKFFYDTNQVLRSYDKWKARHDKIWYTLDKFEENGSFEHLSDEYEILSAHMFLRAFNQVNEACNRLWATVELFLHSTKEDLFCDSFNVGFLPTSLVPTLHYANITAIMSILSLYGLCSFRKPYTTRDYRNLIRCGDLILLVKRQKYIKQLTGSRSEEWHVGILRTCEALLKHGVKLPSIDLPHSFTLLKKRNALDYDLLGQTTMSGAFGERIYLHFLPYVTSNLEHAITSITTVAGNMSNEADKRFYQLKEKVVELTSE